MDDPQIHEVARSLDVELTQSGTYRLAHPADLTHDLGHELSEHANGDATHLRAYGSPCKHMLCS